MRWTSLWPLSKSGHSVAMQALTGAVVGAWLPDIDGDARRVYLNTAVGGYTLGLTAHSAARYMLVCHRQ